MSDLTGKIALITGSTSGIGEASAILFAKCGATVIVSGRSYERGQDVIAKINKEGGKNSFIKCDVSDENSVNELYSNVMADYEHIDILFNNAGILPVVPSLENMTTDTWENVFNINSTGVFRVTKAFMPELMKTHGVILNTASVAGLQSFASGKMYAYGASKASVIQFTRMIAKMYGESVRANCICPGVVDTPIFIDRDFSKYTDRIPMRRVAQPEEIAKVAAFLCSDEAGYINGAVIPVDGGQSL